MEIWEYKNLLEKIKEERKEIWEAAYLKGYEDAMKEVKEFNSWFSISSDVKVEIDWFTTARTSKKPSFDASKWTMNSLGSGEKQ